METKKAVQFFGSRCGLARALGISRQAVCRWQDTVPASRVHQVEAAMAQQAQQQTEGGR